MIQKKNDLKLLKYEDSQGSYEYRSKLSNYYSKHNIDVTPEDIIVTVGASEALSFTFSSICDPGEEIIIPEPFYANYNGFAMASNVKVIPITSKIQDNFSLPSISSFEEKINKNTKAIFLCNPCNPTGYVYSKDEILEIGSLAIKHDIFIVVDEVYREFIYGNNKHFSILEEKKFYNNAILIDSSSKRYSLCGARSGCVVSKNHDFLGACLKFALARLSPPTLGLIAASKALDSSSDYINNVINEYTIRRNLLIEELSKINNHRGPDETKILENKNYYFDPRKIDDLVFSNPMGAFYSILKLPLNNSDKFSKFLLTDFSHNGQTVMLAPAGGFYTSPNLGKDEVRIAFVLNSEKLLKAIKIIGLALKEYKD